MLEIRDLKGGYGGNRLIVDGIDLDVAKGEIVTIIGQNGAGKSTILKTIFGLTPVRYGSIRLDSQDIFGVRPHRMLETGLAYIPQHHSVFPKLTIAENLRMGGYLLTDSKLLHERMEQVEEMFPILKSRRLEMAASLSGGEQRMLEIARTLIMNPKLIMLDEPSIGLAPKMVELVFKTARELAQAGKAVLMVEQNVKKALLASDRGYVLELGQVRIHDQAHKLIADERVSRLYMGVRT